MPELTVIILTHNEEKHITACIESAAAADAIIVFDSFSTDHTVELAKAAGAVVIQNPFEDYAQQRNAALSNVTEGWVLFVDADERITPELAAEVRENMDREGYAGFRIPRHNYIFGKLTLGAGWYPDYQTRLLKVGKAHYDPLKRVHEVVILDGLEGTLQNPLLHYNYEHSQQFADKQRRYTAFEAKILHEKGIRPKPQNYVLQPLRHFWWRFVTLRGYQDGLHGLRLSCLMSWYELKKYLTLRKLWQNASAVQK